MCFTFIKNYKDQDMLRESFNRLAGQIYGLNFEKWYQLGFWNERYIPYSFIYENDVVANISVNIMDVIIEGEKKNAIQIGTVMTHPNFRNQGLIKKLFEIMLSEYEGQVDFIYLYANESVLDFYPKLGFRTINESQFIQEINNSNSQKHNLKKLDINHQDDLELITRLTKNRKSISKFFSVINDQNLLMFYCLYVFSNHLYYLEDEDCLVIFNVEGDSLNLYDVITSNDIKLDDIINQLVTEEVKNIIFHFTPDTTSPLEITPEDRHLFIRGKDINLNHFRFPITSIA